MPCFTIFFYSPVLLCGCQTHIFIALYGMLYIAGFETKCRCILPLITRLSRLAVGTVQWEDSTLPPRILNSPLSFARKNETMFLLIFFNISCEVY